MELMVLVLAFALIIIIGFCLVYKLGTFLEESKEGKRDSEIQSMMVKDTSQKASAFRVPGGVSLLGMIKQFYLRHQIKRNIF